MRKDKLVCVSCGVIHEDEAVLVNRDTEKLFPYRKFICCNCGSKVLINPKNPKG
jgi:DNA-directed RNA polymerase subunit RPC12/RpoP